MVALDHGGIAETGFNHVGVNRALDQEIDLADFLCLRLEDTDKFFADDLTLRFGLGYARELGEEAIFCVHADKMDIPLGERRFDLIALVLAHQTVVDKYARELIANCLCHERRSNRGVHAARERKQCLAGADLFADQLDGILPVVCHGPVAVCLADAI